MWIISHGEKLRFLTSKPYTNLAFDIFCSPTGKQSYPTESIALLTLIVIQIMSCQILRKHSILMQN